jgi:hypothetical protein
MQCTAIYTNWALLKRKLIEHCNKNLIFCMYFQKSKANFHIHVSVSDLNIPRIGPHIFLQQNRQTNRGDI